MCRYHPFHLSLLHKHNEYPAAIPVAHQPVVCGSLSRCAVCLKQGYQWLKDKILSEEGRRQQAKLKELQAIAERLGCTLPQLAIGTPNPKTHCRSLSFCLSVRPSCASLILSPSHPPLPQTAGAEASVRLRMASPNKCN